MSDPERGAYTPPTNDAPLSFDARQPVRGASPPPYALIIAVLVLVAVAGVIFVIYRSGVRQAGQAPQVVGTPLGAIKSAPPAESQPQDPAAGRQIYRTEPGQPAQAVPAGPPKFAPGPEQPQPRNLPPVVLAPSAPPPQAAPTAPVAATPLPPAAPPAAKPAPVAPAPLPVTRLAPTPPAAAPPTPKPVAAAPVKAPEPKPEPKAEAKTTPPRPAPKTIDQALANASKPEPKPAAKAAPATPTPAPVAAGGAAVQIGAFSSQALADKGWSDAMAIAPGGKSKSVEKIDKNGSTLFRTAVTGFADKAHATAFCDKLKAAGKSCFVR